MKKIKGNLEIEIFKEKTSWVARIKPKGFWSDVITVYFYQNIGSDSWRGPEIGWGSGGQNSVGTNKEKVGWFIEGLIEAMRIAKRWERQNESHG